MREWSCAPPSRGMSSPCHHRFGTLGCEGEHFFTNFLRTIHSSLMTAAVQLECEYPGVNRPPHRKVPLPEPPSQFGNIVPGVYTPVLAKHSKHFSLEDSLAIGVDRMQRNFEPLKQQVEEWQAMQLSTVSSKLLIYQAFIEDELGFPKHLARRVHELYFQPVHEEFKPRTMWSLSNAFTSAFKELEPIPQYKATAKLAGFLQAVRPQ